MGGGGSELPAQPDQAAVLRSIDSFTLRSGPADIPAVSEMERSRACSLAAPQHKAVADATKILLPKLGRGAIPVAGRCRRVPAGGAEDRRGCEPAAPAGGPAGRSWGGQLTHRGALLPDEAPEFASHVLDVLCESAHQARRRIPDVGQLPEVLKLRASPPWGTADDQVHEIDELRWGPSWRATGASRSRTARGGPR